jgi:hypothetical protein
MYGHDLLGVGVYLNEKNDIHNISRSRISRRSMNILGEAHDLGGT